MTANWPGVEGGRRVGGVWAAFSGTGLFSLEPGVVGEARWGRRRLALSRNSLAGCEVMRW